MFEQLSEMYYSVEDKYYEILDKIDEKVPIYANLIDPIDKIFPSFILFIVILFLILFAIIWMILGAGGANVAKFAVLDESGNAISGANIELSLGDKFEQKLSDTFGEFETNFFGKGVLVAASHEGFEDFNALLDIESGKAYVVTLALPGSGEVKAKTITYQLLDETRNEISNSTQVRISFACSGPARTPQAISGSGPVQRVSAQTNCGTLSATINAVGFNEQVKQANVALQEGAVVVALSRKAMFASVSVNVIDTDTAEAIEGVSLSFKSGDVTTLFGGTTDYSGSKLVERVPAGAYFIEAVPPSSSGYPSAFSDEFTIGEAQFSSGEPEHVTIRLKRPENPAVIKLKLEDSVSGSAVSSAQGVLVIDNEVSSITIASDEAGILEFINIAPEQKYNVIISHQQYLLRVIDANVVKPSAGPAVVKLVKATSANSGTARVKVSDFSGAGVENSQVALYSRGLNFPIGTLVTGSLGVVDFNNLPAGDYNASALAQREGVTYSGNSGIKTLAAGSVTQYPIVLVISSGKIEVSVKDETGKAISGAEVSFIDSAGRGVLHKELTASSGKTSAVEFKVDRQPYIFVKKSGFYDFTSVAYVVQPNQKIAVEVVLRTFTTPNVSEPFDVEIAAVLDSSKKTATKLDANKLYYFKLNVVVVDNASNLRIVTRAGLNSQINAQDSNIVIKSVSAPVGTNTAFSNCFTPSAIFAPCGSATTDFILSGAKQSIADLGDRNSGIYEILIGAYIGNAAGATPIEFHFGGTGAVGGNTVYREDSSTLYVWRSTLSTPFCIKNCGLSMGFLLQDQGAQLLPDPVAMQNGSRADLLIGTTYKIDYSITNLSNSAFSNLSLNIANTPKVSGGQPLAISSSAIPIARLGGGETVDGSITFTTNSAVGSTNIDFNLANADSTQLGVSGSYSRLGFGVAGLRAMSVLVTPNMLVPGQGNNVDVFVKDLADNKPVENADVIFYNSATKAQVPGLSGKTGANGYLSLRIDQSYEPGSITFDVNATKTGYIRAGTTLGVGQRPIVPIGLDCITVDDALPDESRIQINGRGGNAEFTLKNAGCGGSINVTLTKDIESDIFAQYSGKVDPLDGTEEFSLAQDASVTIRAVAGKVFGVQPIFVNAELPANPDQQLYAGAVRLKVVPPASTGTKMLPTDLCLFAARPQGVTSPTADEYTFAFDNGSDFVVVLNRCHPGILADENTTTNGPAMPLVALPDFLYEVGNKYDVSDGTGTITIDLTKTGTPADRFIAINPQDYVLGGQ